MDGNVRIFLRNMNQERIVLVVTVLIFAAAVIETVLQYLLTALPWMVLTAVLPEPTHGWIGGLSGAAARIITATAAASVPVMLYLDGRVRAEGLDLQLSAAEAFEPLEAAR